MDIAMFFMWIVNPIMVIIAMIIPIAITFAIFIACYNTLRQRFGHAIGHEFDRSLFENILYEICSRIDYKRGKYKDIPMYDIVKSIKTSKLSIALILSIIVMIIFITYSCCFYFNMALSAWVTKF